MFKEVPNGNAQLGAQTLECVDPHKGDTPQEVQCSSRKFIDGRLHDCQIDLKHFLEALSWG